MIQITTLGTIKFIDFLPGAYSFSHKIWGGQKRQLTKIYFITVALSLSFSSDTHIDAISGISTQKFILLQYCFSKKYYNIRISTLLNFVRFTWALNREENLKVAGRLFESLWY